MRRALRWIALARCVGSILLLCLFVEWLLFLLVGGGFFFDKVEKYPILDPAIYFGVPLILTFSFVCVMIGAKMGLRKSLAILSDRDQEKFVS